MQPVEEGKPCHEIFQCDPELSCATPVEADFYAISRSFMAAEDYVRDPLMCSICAGSSHDAGGGQVDADLKTVFAVVLPICATCMREGAKFVVGRYLPNGQTLLKRLEHDRQMTAASARGRV